MSSFEKKVIVFLFLFVTFSLINVAMFFTLYQSELRVKELELELADITKEVTELKESTSVLPKIQETLYSHGVTIGVLEKVESRVEIIVTEGMPMGVLMSEEIGVEEPVDIEREKE